jgi:hypothetical protein
MVNIEVHPRILVGIATHATAEEVLKWSVLRNEVSRQAIECVLAMDPEQLKDLVVQGLQDANAYPSDFTEVHS